MNNKRCPICGNDGEYIFSHEIMGKYDVKYYKCNRCFFLYTEKPFWLEEAYSSSITNQDTGIMQRNIVNAKLVSRLLKSVLKIRPNKENVMVDFGGGAGIFVRLIRDKGYNFFVYDKYAEPLYAQGFAYTGGVVDVVTAFEVFEHMENPVTEIEKIISITDIIIVSTCVYGEGLENPNIEWDYFGYKHGQHISFFSQKTMEWIASNYNLNYYDLCGYHIFTKECIAKTKITIWNIYYKVFSWLNKGRYLYCKKDAEIIRKNRNTR